MAIVYVDGDTPLSEEWAKQASEWLVEAYPNHSWWVECKGGVMIIKHFMLAGLRGTIGMVRHMSAMEHDVAKRKKDIINSAGELLERAHMKRGANDGTVPNVFELETEEQGKRFMAPFVVPVIH